MKKIRLLALLVGLFVSFLAVPVEAQGIWGACEESGGSAICADTGEDGTEATDIVTNLINLFLFAIGALAVVMIIHSGFKYVNSRGDAEGVKSAKNTLLYAVIGLIVALLAYAIVDFVIDSYGKAGGGNTEDDTSMIEMKVV